jgi:hypothetical protein
MRTFVFTPCYRLSPTRIAISLVVPFHVAAIAECFQVGEFIGNAPIVKISKWIFVMDMQMFSRTAMSTAIVVSLKRLLALFIPVVPPVGVAAVLTVRPVGVARSLVMGFGPLQIAGTCAELTLIYHSIFRTMKQFAATFANQLDTSPLGMIGPLWGAQLKDSAVALLRAVLSLMGGERLKWLTAVLAGSSNHCVYAPYSECSDTYYYTILWAERK